MSKGMKNRLSFARAVLRNPEILFLDEPTLGLDVIARQDMWQIIRSLRGRATVILTTHYMEEAEVLSDRVGIMKDGHLLAIGTPQELKEMTKTDNFEKAFIHVVKGVSR